MTITAENRRLAFQRLEIRLQAMDDTRLLDAWYYLDNTSSEVFYDEAGGITMLEYGEALYSTISLRGLDYEEYESQKRKVLTADIRLHDGVNPINWATERPSGWYRQLDQLAREAMQDAQVTRSR